jgi:hypothetical protein
VSPAIEGVNGGQITSCIAALSDAAWWQDREATRRVKRTYRDYDVALRRILARARCLMFIDPHLDPAKPRYRAALKLIASVGARVRPPTIEVHRMIDVGSGPTQSSRSSEEWQETFGAAWRNIGIRVPTRVFLWKRFHDRYLISDIVGLSLSNGFDTDDRKATWSRLTRNDSEDVQREFDPASGERQLVARFAIGRHEPRS